MIKREILTSREVLYTKLARVIVLVLPKKSLPKYGFFSLKMSPQAKKNRHSMFLKIFQDSTDEEMGKKSKLVEFFNSKPFSNSYLRD